MRLTKRQSLITALAILVVFFALATAIVKRARPAGKSADDRRTESAQPPSSELGPDRAAVPQEMEGKSKVVLNEFHRSETRDGQKLWEVTAKHGQYFPETNTAQLNNATLFFFRKNGEVVTLEAKRAALFFDSYTLTRADLTDGLELSFKGEATLRTETATYDRPSNTVRAPGKVNIKHDLADISGEDLTADITTGRVTLARNVETKLKPKKTAEREKK